MFILSTAVLHVDVYVCVCVGGVGGCAWVWVCTMYVGYDDGFVGRWGWGMGPIVFLVSGIEWCFHVPQNMYG